MNSSTPSARMRSAPLRRTRRDLIATGVLAVAALVGVGGAWLTAPIRAVDHTTAHSEAATGTLVDVPSAVTPTFQTTDMHLPGVHRPVVVSGLVFGTDGHTLTAYDNSGAEVYRYGRSDRVICSLGEAWNNVVVTFRSGIGCGDAVSLDGPTGEYSATRSAINDDAPLAVASNDRVGTASENRVELWRSDLVRSVEYGEVEAAQEPGLQPHEACTITSALTRTEVLAVTEVCPDNPDTAMLRMQEATPEESRKPEITASIELSSPDARLVGIGEDTAAVYTPGDTPTVRSFDTSGRQLAATPVEASDLLDDAEGVFVPPTGDLPHHMSYYDGRRLYLLSPSTLKVSHIIDGVRGTGVAVGGKLLAPITNGIAVINWSTGTQEDTIDVERDGWDGDVHLEVAGGILVEKRGDTLVGLTPN